MSAEVCTAVMIMRSVSIPMEAIPVDVMLVIREPGVLVSLKILTACTSELRKFVAKYEMNVFFCYYCSSFRDKTYEMTHFIIITRGMDRKKSFSIKSTFVKYNF